MSSLLDGADLPTGMTLAKYSHRGACRQNHANIALAARRLGVSRNTVYKHVAPA